MHPFLNIGWWGRQLKFTQTNQEISLDCLVLSIFVSLLLVIVWRKKHSCVLSVFQKVCVGCVCVHTHRERDLFIYVHACSVIQSCPTLQPHGLQPTRLLCPQNFPGKNTGIGSHFFIQWIFPTQESNPHLSPLLHWQADCLPLSHLGSMYVYTYICTIVTEQFCSYNVRTLQPRVHVSGKVQIWLLLTSSLLPYLLYTVFPPDVSSICCLTSVVFQKCLQYPDVYCQVNKAGG